MACLQGSLSSSSRLSLHFGWLRPSVSCFGCVHCFAGVVASVCVWFALGLCVVGVVPAWLAAQLADKRTQTATSQPIVPSAKTLPDLSGRVCLG